MQEMHTIFTEANRTKNHGPLYPKAYRVTARAILRGLIAQKISEEELRHAREFLGHGGYSEAGEPIAKFGSTYHAALKMKEAGAEHMLDKINEAVKALTARARTKYTRSGLAGSSVVLNPSAQISINVVNARAFLEKHHPVDLRADIDSSELTDAKKQELHKYLDTK